MSRRRRSIAHAVAGLVPQREVVEETLDCPERISDILGLPAGRGLCGGILPM